MDDNVSEDLNNEIVLPESMRLTQHPLIVREYLVILKDKNLRMFSAKDRRLKTIGYRCQCDIRLTRRILNRRYYPYYFTKYAIIRLSGPSTAAIEKCNRLIEKAFPEYYYRRDYLRSNRLTIFCEETTIDNINTHDAAMHIGQSRDTFGGLNALSHYRTSKKRPAMACPWKVDTNDAAGCYYPPEDGIIFFFDHKTTPHRSQYEIAAQTNATSENETAPPISDEDINKLALFEGNRNTREKVIETNARAMGKGGGATSPAITGMPSKRHFVNLMAIRQVKTQPVTPVEDASILPPVPIVLNDVGKAKLDVIGEEKTLQVWSQEDLAMRHQYISSAPTVSAPAAQQDLKPQRAYVENDVSVRSIRLQSPQYKKDYDNSVQLDFKPYGRSNIDSVRRSGPADNRNSDRGIVDPFGRVSYDEYGSSALPVKDTAGGSEEAQPKQTKTQQSYITQQIAPQMDEYGVTTGWTTLANRIYAEELQLDQVELKYTSQLPEEVEDPMLQLFTPSEKYFRSKQRNTGNEIEESPSPTKANPPINPRSIPSPRAGWSTNATSGVASTDAQRRNRYQPFLVSISSADGDTDEGDNASVDINFNHYNGQTNRTHLRETPTHTVRQWTHSLNNVSGAQQKDFYKALECAMPLAAYAVTKNIEDEAHTSRGSEEDLFQANNKALPTPILSPFNATFIPQYMKDKNATSYKQPVVPKTCPRSWRVYTPFGSEYVIPTQDNNPGSFKSSQRERSSEQSLFEEDFAHERLSVQILLQHVKDIVTRKPPLAPSSLSKLPQQSPSRKTTDKEPSSIPKDFSVYEMTNTSDIMRSTAKERRLVNYEEATEVSKLLMNLKPPAATLCSSREKQESPNPYSCFRLPYHNASSACIYEWRTDRELNSAILLDATLLKKDFSRNADNNANIYSDFDLRKTYISPELDMSQCAVSEEERQAQFTDYDSRNDATTLSETLTQLQENGGHKNGGEMCVLSLSSNQNNAARNYCPTPHCGYSEGGVEMLGDLQEFLPNFIRNHTRLC